MRMFPLFPAVVLLAIIAGPQTLPAQTFYSHGDPTAREQLLLEFINRARLDPPAEGVRLGRAAEFASYPARPPLAFHAAISRAARSHNDDMAANDFFAHTGSDGSAPGDRVIAAGYPSTANTVGENITYGVPTALGAEQLNMIDAGVTNLAHRRNYLEFDRTSSLYRETGIAFDEDSKALLTHDFARRSVMLATGVAFQDADGDDFYSEGEGQPGFTVTSPQSSYSTTTSASGGYALPLDLVGTAPTVTVVFKKSAATYTRRYTVSFAGGDSFPDNLKSDLRVGRDVADGTHPPFFLGELPLGNGVYYLIFANGNSFGTYSYLTDPNYIYSFNLGYEYLFDAQDGQSGIYLYDFASQTFFYTSPIFHYPYLYDFTLNAVLYYYADTVNPRYFYNFATGQIITK